MFISGFIAERVNLRYFLALGMLFSGIYSYMFGIAKTYSIHNLSYYIVVQVSIKRFEAKILMCVNIGFSWNRTDNWLARCCNGNEQLVWKEKTRFDFWSLELAH